MPYLPSFRIWELLKVKQAGVWLDRSTNSPGLGMVAKLPMSVIRTINAGATVPRVQYENAAYHVMARGNRREPIVHDDGDRELFAGTFAEACGRTGQQVFLKSAANASQQIRRFALPPERQLPKEVRAWKLSSNVA